MATAQALNTAQQIYIAFYQRPADPAGLRFWADQIDLAGGDLTKVINNFASSPEAVALYGPINANTIGNVVGAIYQAAFGRAPAALNPPVQSKYGPLANEAEFYTKGFAAGDFTAGSIALAVLQGAQGADAGAVLNKVQTANAFTAAVDGRALTDAAFGQGTGFAATYNGADINAARTYLAGVTSNPSTVPSATQVNAFVAASIADAGDPIKNTTSSGQTFSLTAGADNRTGTAGDDTFDGSSASNVNTPNTLNAFDSIVGGNGFDRIVVAQNIADSDFQNTKGVEGITTSGRPAGGGTPIATTINLGGLAQAAGITDIDSSAAFTTLTIGAGYTNEILRANLLSGSGVVTGNFANTTSNTVIINDEPANTNFRVNFLSGGVGNGSGFDASSALAVTLQRETAADSVAGGVSRFSDEGITFASSDATVRFDVRGLNAAGAEDPAQNRGTHQQVVLGSQGADTLTFSTQNGVAALTAGVGVYINGGAGNDSITGSANVDFLVGGAGDDSILGGGGNDSILAGDGNDFVNVNTASLDSVVAGAGDDVVLVGPSLAAMGLANTRDSLAGGDGVDVLAGTVAALTGATAAQAGQTATISGFEAVRFTNTFAGATLTAANVQAGLQSVIFDAANNNGTINFEAGARTVQVGAEAVGSLGAGGTLNGGALVVNAAGTAADDALTLLNGRTTGAVNVFNGQSVTAGGYETLNINTGTVLTAPTQTLATVAVNPTTATSNVTVNLTGANRVAINSLTSSSTGVVTINAEGLTQASIPAIGGNPAVPTLVLTTAASAGNGNVAITGSGFDDLIVIQGRGLVNAGAGNDNVRGSAGNDTLSGGDGNDLIRAFDGGNDGIDAGAGDDTVEMLNTLTSADTVAGGDGRDTLAISAAGAAGDQVNVSGFEALRLDAGITQSLVQFINNTTFDTVALNNATAGQAFVVSDALPAVANLRLDNNVTGPGSSATFTALVNTATNTLNVFAQDGDPAAMTRTVLSLVLNGAGTTLNQGTDILNLNGRANAVAGDELFIQLLRANDVDTINVNSGQLVTLQNVGTGDVVRNITVNATNAGSFNFGVNNANAIGADIGVTGNSNLTINGSANGTNRIVIGEAPVAGNNQANGADSITGGALADTLSGGLGRDTITGNGGDDVITGGSGSDVINTGVGLDSIRYGFHTESREVAAGNLTSLDRITDFVGNGAAAGDTIALNATIFNGNGYALPAAGGNVTIGAAININNAASLAEIVAGVTGAANTAYQVNVLTGAAAGTYLFINNNTAGASATDDFFVNITGITGNLAAGDIVTF